METMGKLVSKMGVSSDELLIEQWEKLMNVLWLAFLLFWLRQPGFVPRNRQPKGLLHNRHGSVDTFTSIKRLPIHPTHWLPFYHIPGPHRKRICDDVTSRISHLLGTLTICVDLMPDDTQTWMRVQMSIRNLDPGIHLQSIGLIH